MINIGVSPALLLCGLSRLAHALALLQIGHQPAGAGAQIWEEQTQGLMFVVVVCAGACAGAFVGPNAYRDEPKSANLTTKSEAEEVVEAGSPVTR